MFIRLVMIVLSLCDGMSCGQIALREIGIKYEKYYASEIDKHCVRQTQLNFPDTIQMGDIETWRDWEIEWSSISLVLAGTPCTGFSFCGKMLNFDDPQSRLFWVFADILNHIRKFNPDVLFLFENVRMKKWCIRVISEALGVWPVLINSNLVSAQNRERYYWSNINTKKVGLFVELHTDISQPEDRRLFLKDILEDDVDKKYFLSKKTSQVLFNHLSRNKEKGNGFGIKPKKDIEKMNSLTVGGNNMSDLIFQRPRGNNSFEKSPTVSSNSFEQNNIVVQLNNSIESNGCQPYQQDRFYDIRYKSPTLLYRAHAILTERIRRLTPTECARLQTVPNWYKWECSETQQYKMLGNGWTIEIIKHILSFLPEEFYHTDNQADKNINKKI